MKRKSARIVLLLAVTLVVLWGAMFVTDYVRCGSLREPIFVLAGITYDDGGSGTYHGLGYTVTVRKHISTEYGIEIEYVEMRVFGKVVSASIT